MNANLSIIIATFNSSKTLQKTFESLLAQTFKGFEVFIIDGLSKDNTVAIIKEYEREFQRLNIPYYWTSEKDSGIYDAWNKALKKTNTDWIAFLGSDDTYYPNALEMYSEAITRNPGINYISSKIELIDKDDRVLKVIGKPYKYKQMNRYMDIAHVGSFHHIDLFLKHGDFDTDYKIVADYDFFMKCGQDIQSAYINGITVRMLNTGVSNNNVGLVYKEFLKIKLKYKKASYLQSYFDYYYAFLRIFKNKITHTLLGRM